MAADPFGSFQRPRRAWKLYLAGLSVLNQSWGGMCIAFLSAMVCHLSGMTLMPNLIWLPGRGARPCAPAVQGRSELLPLQCQVPL